MNETIQKTGRYTWLVLIMGALICYLFRPEYFTPEFVQTTLSEFNQTALAIYLLISVVRGLFLLPSTPFVIAGVLLFPEQYGLVFAISMIGIIVGSALIYFLADRLSIGMHFKSKTPRLYEKTEDKMQKHGFPIIVGWSFFPAVPTDLICYLAGILRIRFWQFIFGITIGESALVALYIYTGSGLLEHVQHWL